MLLRNIVCVFLLLYSAESKPTEIKCPDYCKCDVFEKLRRATCQNKKLYSIEIDIPPQAEILDLSYNQISELGSHIFLEIGLTNLKLLNLSHNKVSQIHLNGFEGLTKLKSLDLSYNMLRYFTEQWFVSLNSLEELYLKGNNLKSINEEPRLSFKHLRVLDLSNCAIHSIHPGIFQNIPNLEVLDISENYLLHFNVEAIQPLTKLNTLLIKDNNFDCKDSRLARLKTYTKNKGIGYKDPCLKKKKKTEQFERMMAIGPQTPEKNVWIYDEEEESMKNVRIVEVCGEKKRNKSFIFESAIDAVLLEVIEMSPTISVLIVLILGVFLGLIFGCSIQVLPKTQEEPENFLLPEGPLVTRRRTMSIGSRLAEHSQETAAFLRQQSAVNKSPTLLRQQSIGSKSTTLVRQHSTGSNFRPRSKSGGSRKMMREDRNVLLVHEAGMSDSTPVISRKAYL